MRILIAQHDHALAAFWGNFLERHGVTATLTHTREQAISALRFAHFDALVLDVELADGGAIAVSDFAAYRQPEIPIVAVSSTGFFSDGTLFDLIPNARSLMREPVLPSDLAAVLDHYAGAAV